MKPGLSFYSQLLVLTVLFTAIASSQVYELIDLEIHYPTGINDSGEVIGWDWYGGNVYYSSVWKDGVKHGIWAPGPVSSLVAEGINRSAQIVGWYYVSIDSGIRHAFIWNDSVLTDLGSFGGTVSSALGISDSGVVAGYAYYPGDVSGHAVLWKNGVMTDLGTLGGLESGATDINDPGHVVGNSRIADSVNVHAFLWQAGGMEDLGTLGGPASSAAAINNLGHVVGNASDADSLSRGYIMQSGAMAELGAIGPRTGFSWGLSIPHDINDSDEVVGQSSWGAPNIWDPDHAFIWKNGVMTDLNTVTDTSGGWALIRATGINNRGDIIGLANYQYGQEQRGFLLKRTGILVTKPKKGDLWVHGEKDTIRWVATGGRLLNIYYTANERAGVPVWTFIAGNVPSDSGMYVWDVPADVNSHFAAIRIQDASDLEIMGTSKPFRLRALELVRLDADSTYTRFHHGIDSWSFSNIEEAMWPASWYSNFNYQSGTDPFLNKRYPSENPFDSARSADFPDWPLFVRTFGEDICYHLTWFGSSRDYNQLATAKWRAIKRTWGGSCSGLSLSSILGFDNRQSVVGRYPSYPASGAIHGVGISDSVRLIINELAQHWFGKQHQEYVSTVQDVRPRALIGLVRESFLDEGNDHSYLYISWTDPKGVPSAHAIVPYKLERDPANAGWYIISVYDVSYPENAATSILIDSTGDSALAPFWSARKLTSVYLMDRSSAYLQLPGWYSGNAPAIVPAASKALQSTIEIWPTLNAFVRIGQSSGGVLAYDSGGIVDSLPGGFYFLTPTASPSPPAVYTVPADSYQVVLNGFADQHAAVSIFGNFWAYSYERSDADSSQTDLVSFNNGLAFGNRDDGSKQIAIESIFDPVGGSMKYRFSGMNLLNGDSVSIAQNNSDGVALINRGLPKVTDLFVKRVTYYKRTAAFYYPALAVAGNATLWLSPGDDSLSTMRVLIDNGIDGTVDDSMFVENQITGVLETWGSGVPAIFTLEQNFPNPFNATTTIRYALPRASHVSLKIYDVLGQHVETLVDDVEGAGYKSVEWNAGSTPSGVYFCRLRTDNSLQMKKLILLK